MANYQNLKAAISAAIRTNGNQEITGQVLQNVLNSIVSVIGANYTFAGVATPATNPGTPDQNVFYIATQGGTYTNFGATALPEGISLLMWNGSWTAKTIMYNDGGVFDISVYKSTGGTLAKFADLGAALGTNGANIPAAARKGGMSVKFVQSSDNKYVQYRLMDQNWSTVVTGWQGVDDEPTAGSENMVKSGGVAIYKSYNYTNDEYTNSLVKEIHIEGQKDPSLKYFVRSCQRFRTGDPETSVYNKFYLNIQSYNPSTEERVLIAEFTYINQSGIYSQIWNNYKTSILVTIENQNTNIGSHNATNYNEKYEIKDNCWGDMKNAPLIYLYNKGYISENVIDWNNGFYGSDKNFHSNPTWRAKEIHIDNSIDAISFNIDCGGNDSYSYLLDSEDNALLTWHKEGVNTTLYLSEYPSATRLLICSRGINHLSANIFINLESQARRIADNNLQSDINNLQSDIDAIPLQIDEYNKNFWKLNPKISLLKNGTLKGTNVPSNNTAIAWYNNIRNLWYIKARLNKGNADRINSGFVVSSSMQHDIMLLAKYIIPNEEYIGHNAAQLDTWNKINGSFSDGASIYNDVDYKRNTVDAALCMSGNMMQCYLDGELKGSSYKGGFSPFGHLYGGILFSANNVVSNIEFGERPSPYAHFSIDDVGPIMRSIAQSSSLSSIFDNEMFSFLLEMHEKYGMCVTLNLFYTINNNTWSLDSFPDTFKQELTDNSSWLKFAFHGGDENIKYNSEDNNTAAINSYTSVINQIIRFAGGSCIDYMPRMSFFSGNKSLFNALKNTGNFWGCLTADDTRAANSGLTETERACINDSADYIDFTNTLYYVRTQHRFDSYTTEQVISLVKSNLRNMRKNIVLEYFTHSMSAKDRTSIEEALKLLVSHHIRMDFSMNNMPF